MRADIMWLGSTDSTNEEARRHISDIDNLSVLSALEQTSGRGQRGNTASTTARLTRTPYRATNTQSSTISSAAVKKRTPCPPFPKNISLGIA